MRRPIFSILAGIIVTSAAGCSTIPAIPIIGGGGDAPSVEVPSNAAPYSSDRTIGAGDVLDVAVYKGLRSSKEIFDAKLAVGSDGTVELGNLGTAAVSGLKVGAAAQAIRSQFVRSARTSADRMTVHIRSVNGTSIVRVIDGVGRPGVILWQKGMTVRQAINAAGGKKPGAGERFVYVSSKGVRRTLVIDGVGESNPEVETEVKPGDIIEVPMGL